MRGVGAVVLALAALFGGGCYESHLAQAVDAGELRDAVADARRDDADVTACVPGSVCDCRAALPVPAGTAWVGYSDGGYSESYAQQITISREYWMNTYEVSAECYRLCIDDGICTAPEAPSAATGKPSWDLPPAYWNDPAFGRRPIVFVEHADATAYCARLGGRLPTSAEWEKMARGEDGRAFPWTAPPSDPQSAFLYDPWISEAEIHAYPPFGPRADSPPPAFVAVDSLPDGRGVYGHFNVIGNATEWVADWARIPVWPRDGALVDPRNDVPSEYGHAARSHFQPAWTVLAPDTSGWPGAGIRCAFDAAPEPMLVE